MRGAVCTVWEFYHLKKLDEKTVCCKNRTFIATVSEERTGATGELKKLTIFL